MEHVGHTNHNIDFHGANCGYNEGIRQFPRILSANESRAGRPNRCAWSHVQAKFAFWGNLLPTRFV